MTQTIQLRSLASGSTGNAYFVRFGDTRVLVDAGIKLGRIQQGLADLGGLEALDAVVVTHEHHDHIRGLDALLRARPELPVFASSGTLRELSLEGRDTRELRPHRAVALGPQLDITGFRVSHDAAEVLGLRFEGFGAAIGFATDLGTWSEATLGALLDVHTLVLESNHDPELLRRGPYPVFLKRRISGTRGHLSNAQAAALLERVLHNGLQRVVLAHLSETNNTPALAQKHAEEVLAGTLVDLHVADPVAFSPIWTCAGGVPRREKVEQLSLFG